MRSCSSRIRSLLQNMTLSDKAAQMCQIPANKEDVPGWIKTHCPGSVLHLTEEQATAYQKMALEGSPGIPLLFGIDAIHGHAFSPEGTVFPSQLTLSAAWNPDLVRRMAELTAVEVAASGIHWTFSPVLGLARDLRWGRADETFGEDPFLAGLLGRAAVEGYQKPLPGRPCGVAACAKHFIAYGESIGGRDSAEAEVSDRKIRSLFWPVFREALEANCLTVMTGYLSIDGLPVTLRKDLIRDLLKGEYGFDGMMVTDWNNVGSLIEDQKIFPDLVEAAAAAVESGNDLIMSTPGFHPAVMSAVKRGILRETRIDEAVLRILCTKERLGLFDHPFPRQEITLETRRKADRFACRSAVESAVLLKNNGLLPLEDFPRTGLFGPAADDWIAQLGDWSFGPEMDHADKVRSIHKVKTSTVYKALLEAGATTAYCRGADYFSEEEVDENEIHMIADGSDLLIAAVGDTLDFNGERRDRSSLNLPGNQESLLRQLIAAGKPLILLMISGRPLILPPEIEKGCHAILYLGNPGQQGGPAAVDLLLGKASPGGRLTVSVPRSEGQLPVYYNRLPGWHARNYCDGTAEAQYPFGFGLTYSPLTIDEWSLENDRIAPGEKIRWKLRISNRGNRPETAVVQLYTEDLFSSVVTPVKELKAFRRCLLEAGESRETELSIDTEKLALIGRDKIRRVEPGDFAFALGFDSREAENRRGRFTLLPR